MTESPPTNPSPIDPSTLPKSYNTIATTSTLYISSHVIIHTSVQAAFRILADPSKYGEWNSFAPKADIKKSTFTQTNPSDGADTRLMDPNAEALSLTALRVGDEVVLHVRMTPSTSSLQQTVCKVRTVANFPPTERELCNARRREVASDMGVETTEDDKKTLRLAWGSERVGLRAERVMELREVDTPEGENGGQRCEFRTWETMNGLLARVVKALYGTALQERFLDWAADLKTEAEKQASRLQ